ncbi:fused MFS/spermidine synthase [Desulfonatronum parangueonense]
MLGLVSQLAQVVLLRELLMVFQGNELSIGIILSSWLAWTGAGSWLGAKIAERIKHSQWPLTISAGCLVPVLPATIALIRNLRGFYDVLPGAYLGLSEIALSCFLVMAPACLLLGAQFVFLARIWRERDKTLGASGASKTYMVEAVGNMTAGILFTFVLVRLLNPFQIITLAALLMTAAAVFLHRHDSVISSKSRGIGLFGLMLAALLLSGLVSALTHVDRWTAEMQWRQFAPDHELVETRPSPHGAIAVLRRDDQFSFFQSGHLIFSTAGLETALPGLEEQDAVTAAHLAMVQHPAPERVLLIGGGLRGMLAEILRHPVRELDYIELDQVLTDTARRYAPARTFEALEHPTVRMIHMDARLFVRSGSADGYDMIIVDAPDPATAVLNRTYTREFFLQVRNLLAPDGVLAIGVASTPDLRGRAISNRNAAIHHTLSDVFSHVVAVGERQLLFFATDERDNVSTDPRLLQERFEQREITAEGFSGLHYHLLLHDPTLRRINWILRHHGRSPGAHLDGPPAPPLLPGPLETQIQAQDALPPVSERFFINSDFRPIAYFYTLMFWNELTRTGTRNTLEPALHVRPWWILPMLLLPALAVLALTFSRAANQAGLKSAVHLAALTTGMSTMLMQVGLLFAFQSIYGFVYETVGLIVAVFMSGLAMGTFLGQRYVLKASDENPFKPRALALIQFGIAGLALTVALLLPQITELAAPLAVLTLFATLTFTAGLAGGIDFPLAAACSTALTGRPEHSAGRIYGLELTGACAGAALAGAVIAPVLGIPACFLLAGALNAMAGFTLLGALLLDSTRGSGPFAAMANE